MSGRLAGKTAIIVGAGQSAGETIGNGRAMAVLFAREGAQVLCVDRHLESALETSTMISAEGGIRGRLSGRRLARCRLRGADRRSQVDLGTDRHPGQQCGRRRRRRWPRAPGRRGSLGSHSDRQSQIRLDDHQARLADHARSKCRRDRQYLLPGLTRWQQSGGLRGLQGGDEPVDHQRGQR